MNYKYLIYKGPGACPVSIENLYKTCKRLNHDSVNYITPEEIAKSGIKGTHFIMPGGRDIPYTRSLKGIGTSNIKRFVEEGGTYIGVCAGAYFGGSYVEFDKEGPLEVLGERELKFYSGTVRGPVYGVFDYYSKKGAFAVEINWTEKLHVYFNGGGTFEGGEGAVIATLPSGEPAIIETKVGKGKALLSSVHFEYLSDEIEDLHIKSKLNDDAIRRLQEVILG